MTKIFSLVIVLVAVGYSQAIPTLGLSLAGSPRPGPGWSGDAGNLYPLSVNPYGSYGFNVASPVYVGSYSQSPSFPGYTPGLYGLPSYLNLRGR